MRPSSTSDLRDAQRAAAASYSPPTTAHDRERRGARAERCLELPWLLTESTEPCGVADDGLALGDWKGEGQSEGTEVHERSMGDARLTRASSAEAASSREPSELANEYERDGVDP